MSSHPHVGGSTSNHRPGLIRRALRRLTSPAESGNGSDRADRESGAIPIGQCPDRERVDLCGDITRVDVSSDGDKPALEVELEDSSGTVTLVWLGRREIPGLEPGRRLWVSGRISRQPGGRRVVFNPWYELS
jgi:hypothetical protein